MLHARGDKDAHELFRKVVGLILTVAPFGIAALMAVTVGRYGADLLGPMARFVAGVTAAHVLLVVLYVVVVALFTPQGPLTFFSETGTVWATTLATTSSLASLPLAMESAGRLGVPRFIYSFTLPLGIQVNKEGTAAMLAAVVEAFKLPLELAVIVGGIYRLVDMGNTTVNVMGNLVGTVLVAASERICQPPAEGMT